MSPSDKLAQFQAESAKTHLSDWVRELETQNLGLYVRVVALWVDIGQMTTGSKSNRLALGKAFGKLRDLYGDRNSGGNRRSSGHGCFEHECLQRGYKPRTVRDLIADYQAFQSGQPSSAEKRKARQAHKVQRPKGQKVGNDQVEHFRLAFRRVVKRSGDATVRLRALRNELIARFGMSEVKEIADQLEATISSLETKDVYKDTPEIILESNQCHIRRAQFPNCASHLPRKYRRREIAVNTRSQLTQERLARNLHGIIAKYSSAKSPHGVLASGNQLCLVFDRHGFLPGAVATDLATKAA